jgi:hypothetical protein
MVEENYQLETEKEVCKEMEKLSHIAEELESCKKLGRNL